jgi:hypothetical protein
VPRPAGLFWPTRMRFGVTVMRAVRSRVATRETRLSSKANRMTPKCEFELARQGCPPSHPSSSRGWKRESLSHFK